MIPFDGWLTERQHRNAAPPLLMLPVPRVLEYEDQVTLRVGPRRFSSDTLDLVDIQLTTVRRSHFTIKMTLRSLFAVCLVDRIE